MKMGNLVKDRKNRQIFIYEDKSYKYDEIYNLVKYLTYRKTGKDCDWQIIKIHDLKDDKDCYALCFQQTMTNEDIWHDAEFLPRPVKAYKGWKNKLVYHYGFYEEYHSAQDEIHNTLKPLLEDLAKEQNCEVKDLKLYIMGWSLGGSIAPIAVEDCFERYEIKPVMIAFEGANPCESKHTRDYIMTTLNLEESISFVYSNDFVPRCAPFFGKQLKDIIYYLDDHKCKFPFYFIKKIISFIKDTPYYHSNTDEGIQKYMN